MNKDPTNNNARIIVSIAAGLKNNKSVKNEFPIMKNGTQILREVRPYDLSKLGLQCFKAITN